MSHAHPSRQALIEMAQGLTETARVIELGGSQCSKEQLVKLLNDAAGLLHGITPASTSTQDVEAAARAIAILHSEDSNDEFWPEWHETARAALSAVAVAVPGWREIDSAPKDGTFVLVAGLSYNAGPGRWMAMARFLSGAWWEGPEDDPVNMHRLYEPTHWMPLPSPPGIAAAPTSPTPAEAMNAAWPNGCPKNSSCARNRCCMYGCAAHKNRSATDLAAEIDAETARRDLTPMEANLVQKALLASSEPTSPTPADGETPRESEDPEVDAYFSHLAKQSAPPAFMLQPSKREAKLEEALPTIVQDVLSDVADFTDGRVTFASDAIDRFIERAIARAALQGETA